MHAYSESGMTSIERIEAVTELKMPDRVPVAPLLDFYCAACAGVSARDYLLGDVDVMLKAVEITYKRHGCAFDMFYVSPSRIFLAGEPILPLSGFYMDFRIPEGKENMQALEKPWGRDVSEFDAIMQNGLRELWRPIKTSDVLKVLSEIPIINAAMRKWEEERKVAMFSGGFILTPLEALSFLMGLQDWAVALHRDRERVIEICDFMLDGIIASGIVNAKLSGVKRMFVSLVRVSPFFIRRSVFEELVFPHLKEIIASNIKEGLVSLLHLDTDWTPWLDYFTEFPKGSCIFECEDTDIYRAKEVLGDRMCVMGNVSSTLLSQGTPEQVKEECRKLIEKCGEGGGFILSSGCDVPPDTPFENVQAMVDAAHTYGVYKK
jgi:hypothetical protein